MYVSTVSVHIAVSLIRRDLGWNVCDTKAHWKHTFNVGVILGEESISSIVRRRSCLCKAVWCFTFAYHHFKKESSLHNGNRRYSRGQLRKLYTETHYGVFAKDDNRVIGVTSATVKVLRGSKVIIVTEMIKIYIASMLIAQLMIK